MRFIDADHAFAEVKDHATGFVQALDEEAHLTAHHTLQWHRLRRHHVHAKAALGQSRRCFQTDEARTYQHGASFGGRRRLQLARTLQGAQRVHVGQVAARHVGAYGGGAGGQDKPVEGYALAVGEGTRSLLRRQLGYLGAQLQGDIALAVVIRRAQSNSFGIGARGEKILRQGRAVVKHRGLVGDNGDAFAIALLAQGGSGAVTGGTAADDDDMLVGDFGACYLGDRLFVGPRHKDRIAALGDFVAGQRRKGGGRLGTSIMQAKGRMVPRTADGLSRYQAFAQWGAVVRAVRPQGKDVAALANQENILVAYVARKRNVVGQGVYGHTLGEVRPPIGGR